MQTHTEGLTGLYPEASCCEVTVLITAPQCICLLLEYLQSNLLHDYFNLKDSCFQLQDMFISFSFFYFLHDPR